MGNEALEIHGCTHTPVGADQVAPPEKLLVVHGIRLHRRPYGHHESDTHLVQLPDHAFGVRPEVEVEVPVALVGPMKEVNDDDIQRQAPAPVLTGDVQQLFLVPVPQLALPEAHGPIRHHGRFACDIGIVALHFVWICAGGDPVVQLPGGCRRPVGHVAAEHHAAHRRVVPQEAVTEGRHHEGHAGLAVAVGQLQLTALDVQEGLLVLAHAVQLLVRVGFEPRGDAVVIGAHVALELAGIDVERGAIFRVGVLAIAQKFTKQKLLSAPKTQSSAAFHLCTDRAVFDGGAVVLNGDVCGSPLGGGQQGPVLFNPHGAADRGAHAQTVGTPGFDPELLEVETVNQAAAIRKEDVR